MSSMHKRVNWTGTGTGDDPRRPDLPEGVGFSVVEDHGDGTVTVETGPDPREGEALKVAARIAVETRVKADDLDDGTVATLALLYEPWTRGGVYRVGDLRSWDGTIIEALQAHTNADPNHTPDITPALWKVHRQAALPGETPAEWVQPESTNPYMTGDKVTFNGKVYESRIDNNVWSPSAYPQGWQLIP